MKKVVCFLIAMIIVMGVMPTAFAAETNLASGCSYTYSHAPKPAYKDAGGELTDGQFGVMNFYDERWVGISGVKNENASITLDLGAKKEFGRVEITLLNSASSGGILYPRGNMIISYSDTVDGEYLPFAMGAVPADAPSNSVYEFILSDVPVNGRYVKIEFKASSWVFISEIEVYKTPIDVKMNLAYGKKYYSVPTIQKTSQPDDGTKLTDGIFGDASDNTDAGWVWINTNYMQIPNHAGSRTVIQGYVVDLGKEMYVTDVKVKFISKGFGGTTEFPWAVWTYASSETGDTLPESYFLLSRQWDVQKAWNSGTLTYGWRSGFKQNAKLKKYDTISGYDSVKTRYIRVDVEAKSYAALDEIVVNGYKLPQSNAYVVTTGKNLDSGEDYLTPEEAGVKDMALCYNGHYSGTRGKWTAAKLRPYLTYVDKSGKVVDTMYDTVCFLAISDPDGGIYNKDVANKSTPQDAKNWYWYLDKTFNEDMVALSEAAEVAATELNDPDYKVQVVVMHPGADGRNGENFGPLDGKYYNMTIADSEYHNYPTVKSDWQLASDWWFDEVIERFNTGKQNGLYDRIEFIGFYYLSEQIGYQPAAPRYHIDRAHELGYKIFFIPFNYANGYRWEDDFNFDGTAIQPNHFFGDPYKDGDTTELGNDYIDTVAFSANYAHTGIEMEFDDRVITNPSYYNLWLDYLNGVYKNNMDGDNCHRAWYQAVESIYNCYKATNPIHRSVYDYSYQIMKGTYTPKSYIETFDDTLGYEISGTALKGATIELYQNGERVAFASSNGSYLFTDMEPGEYTLKVIKSKYATREYSFILAGDTVVDTALRFIGDVTGDGVINNSDVIQINRRNSNLSSVFSSGDEYLVKVADVMEDSVVNNNDVIQINRKISNLSSVFDRM